MQRNTLYKLRGTTIIGGATASTEVGSEDKAELWNHRLGHMSKRGFQELHKKNLLEDVSHCKLDFCKCCTLGKQTKTSFKVADSEKRSKEALYYFYTHVWGPVPTRSKGGFRFFEESLGLLYEGEIRGFCQVQGVETRSRKSDI